MKLDLTDEERSLALDYARRLERNARFWRIWRWFGIAALLLSLVLTAVAVRMDRKIQTVTDLPMEILNPGVAPTPELNASMIELVVTYVRLRAVALRTELLFLLKILVAQVLAVAVFLSCLVNWRRGDHDRLAAKILRQLVAPPGADSETDPR